MYGWDGGSHVVVVVVGEVVVVVVVAMRLKSAVASMSLHSSYCEGKVGRKDGWVGGWHGMVVVT